MATGTIKNEDVISETSALPISGAGAITMDSCHQIKYGKIVHVSLRCHPTSSVTNGLSLLYGQLAAFPPAREGSVPGVTVIGSAARCDLVSIVKVGNNYYARQIITNNISANTAVEMYFSYPAAE